MEVSTNRINVPVPRARPRVIRKTNPYIIDKSIIRSPNQSLLVWRSKKSISSEACCWRSWFHFLGST